MHWKRWPYWARGGIIAVFFLLLLWTLGVSFGTSLLSSFTVPPVLLPLLATSRGIEPLFSCTVSWSPARPDCQGITELVVQALVWLIVFGLYMGVGACIGFLYGKLKTRKQRSTGFPLSQE